MKYYKHENKTMAFESDGSQDNYIPSDAVEMSQAEVNAHLAPTPKTQEEINAEHRAYLASTDWYVTRKMETGEEIPQDILDARQAAREGVVE